MMKEHEELEMLMTEPDFWDDQAGAKKTLRKAKAIKTKLEEFDAMETAFEEMQLLVEMGLEDEDDSIEKEATTGIEKLIDRIENMTLQTLLSGEYDGNNAILSINAGAGGLDAQDWAEMLFRMYNRWAAHSGFEVEILDILNDTEAGIKNVSMAIRGINAYGYLKSEKGVHRIVRISPFDSSGKRHTSFTSVDVMPELDEDVEVDLNPSDLKVDTYRASGAGGQHINTTDSAVRITHIPTGVVVQCQNERSQISNRSTAMRMLMSKLIELKIQEQKDKVEDLAGDYSQIAWGSQIRSYVFHPYNLVKDHRTNFETGNVQAVMDGDIQAFINAYLKMLLKED